MKKVNIFNPKTNEKNEIGAYIAFEYLVFDNVILFCIRVKINEKHYIIITPYKFIEDIIMKQTKDEIILYGEIIKISEFLSILDSREVLTNINFPLQSVLIKPISIHN